MSRMAMKWQALSTRQRVLACAAGIAVLVALAAVVAHNLRAKFVKAMRMNAIHTSYVAEQTNALLRQVQAGSDKTRELVQQLQAGEGTAGQAGGQRLADSSASIGTQGEIAHLRKELQVLRERIAPGGGLLPLGNVPGARMTLPADARPAAIRDLPFPFAKYFSIASDADSMSFDAASKIYDTLNRLNLPIADSTFLEAGPVISKRASPDAPALPSVALVDLLTGDSVLENRLARWFQNGQIDTHHGLFSPFHLSAVTDGPTTIRQADAGKPAARAVIPLKRYFAFSSANFFPEAPPDLVFQYMMPIQGEATFRLVGGSGAVLWTSGEVRLPSRITPTVMGLPLAGLKLGEFNRNTNLSLEIEYSSSGKTAFLQIDAVGMADRSRGRAALGFGKARELNVQIPVFSRHTMPPAANLGVGGLHTLPDTLAWAHIFQGDNPKSPLYWADLLDAHGVEFVGRDTSVDEMVFDISQLTYPYLFNDGRMRYSFHRLFYSRNAGADSSLESGIGNQFNNLFPLITAAPRGAGGLLYTHWGIPLPKEQFDLVGGEWPLSKPTLDGLTQLAGRYYGVLNGERLPPGERWWIAPGYRQMVYSAVHRQIREHVFVSADGMNVHIRPFVDPVTQRRIPREDFAGKRLQGITIYVQDAALARAYVDGIEFHSFTRNPADETGRQSITFVDNSTPTVVFDEVDLQHRPGQIIQRNARVFPSAERPFSGERAMEIVTQGRNGLVEWRPEALTCSRADAFQFALRKSAPGVRATIILTDANDQSWEFAEGEAQQATPGAAVARFASAGSNVWTVQTFSFAHLQQVIGAKSFAPWGQIKSVRFLVSGEQGDSIAFDRVACLRENPLDEPAQGFRVSGQISFDGVPAGPTRVEMIWGGKTVETTSDANGIYAFSQFVPRDAVIMVNAVGGPNKDKYAPTQGRLVQATNNIADLDIIVSKEQRGPDLAGSVPAGTAATGQYVNGAGNHYRPGSRLTTTGLSNPTEFRTDLFVNNLGYIDREQRPTRMSPRAKRIAVLGACNIWGHTEGVYFNTATVMESLLRTRSNEPVEVMNMSTATQHAGVSWFFYDRLARDYKPDVVYYELVGPLDVGLSHPHFASNYNMTRGTNLPNSTFVPDGNGGLREQRGDPAYINFPITDQAIIDRRNQELKDNAYIIDGVNFMYLFHRDPVAAPFNEREREIMNYYRSLIREVKKRFEADGIKVVFLVTDHFGQGGAVPPTIKDQPYHRRHFDTRMRQLCTDANAECLQFVPWMEERFSDMSMRHWRRDSHYSRVGYRWFAEAMVEHYLAKK